MSYAIRCDGCKKVLAEANWGRLSDATLDVPDNTWVVEPPGGKDKLRRYAFQVHVCTKKCLIKWASKEDGYDS